MAKPVAKKSDTLWQLQKRDTILQFAKKKLLGRAICNKDMVHKQ